MGLGLRFTLPERKGERRSENGLPSKGSSTYLLADPSNGVGNVGWAGRGENTVLRKLWVVEEQL